MGNKDEMEDITVKKRGCQPIPIRVKWLITMAILGGLIFTAFIYIPQLKKQESKAGWVDSEFTTKQKDDAPVVGQKAYMDKSITKFKQLDDARALRIEKQLNKEIGFERRRGDGLESPSYVKVLSYQNEVLAMPESHEKTTFLMKLNNALLDSVLTNREYNDVEYAYLITKESQAKRALASTVKQEL